MHYVEKYFASSYFINLYNHLINRIFHYLKPDFLILNVLMNFLSNYLIKRLFSQTL